MEGVWGSETHWVRLACKSGVWATHFLHLSEAALESEYHALKDPPGRLTLCLRFMCISCVAGKYTSSPDGSVDSGSMSCPPLRQHPTPRPPTPPEWRTCFHHQGLKCLSHVTKGPGQRYRPKLFLK